MPTLNPLRGIGLALAALLMSCGGEAPAPPPAASTPAQSSASHTDDPTAGLRRLPKDLQHAVLCRHEYVPRIEVEPSIKGGEVDDAAIRAQLLKHQALVDKSMAASTLLRGTLPVEPKFTEVEALGELHMNQPRAVLIWSVRLLRADAIRCWENREFEECAKRFAAALDTSAFLLDQSDGMYRLSGGMSYIGVMLDLEAVCDAGFPADAPPELRKSLGRQLHSIDPSRFPGWDPASEAAQVREKLLRLLPG